MEHTTARKIPTSLQDDPELCGRLSKALGMSHVGFWEWELEGDIVHYSEQWKRQLGFSGREIGTTLAEWENRLHPDDHAEALQRVSDLRNGESDAYEHTYRLRHRDGGWRWISSKGGAVRDMTGKLIRVIGTNQDVSSYKEVEENLRRAEQYQREARELAERASDAKSQFLATISHEIRTAMNGVWGTLQMLKQAGMPHEQMELLKMGERSSRWMLSIIGEGLDLARIEAGKIDLAHSPFDLRRLVNDLLGLKSPVAEEKGLALLCTIGSELPEVLLGDSLRLYQILLNLLTNAIKFTPVGEVRFVVNSYQLEDPSKVRVRFVIEDTGVGISPEIAQSMFLPFKQGKAVPSSQPAGLGLGLAITKELTERMGGQVTFTSRPGIGSRFVVTVPLQIASPSGPGPSEPEPCSVPLQFHGEVLVAEDDPVSRELICMMLGRLGLHADSAEDGVEALQKALLKDYDLAVFDCWMPGMDGLALTRMIRSHEKESGTTLPVIALTANARASDIQDCMEAGMNDYLSKPLFFETLQESIARFLPIHYSPH